MTDRRAWLVGFDADAVQDYVFGAVRPTDIAGASWLVERFAVEAGDAAAATGCEVVYVGGGNGTFFAPDESAARALTERLETSYREHTKGAATVAAAFVPTTGRFADDRRALAVALAQRKSHRALDTPSDTVIEVGTWPTDVCEACGRERATTIDRVGDHEERIGEQCRERRLRGRAGRPPQRDEVWIDVTRDLSEITAERSSLIAAVYLDADRAGQRLAEFGNPEDLSRFATALRQATRKAIFDAVDVHHLEGKVVAPVVGGDDVLLLCDASHACALVDTLWRRLDHHQRDGGLEPLLAFSGGVAITSPQLPLRVAVRSAQEALGLAKQARRPDQPEAHVALLSVSERRLHTPGQPIFGRAIPRSCWWGAGPSVRELVEAMSKVGRTQRAGLAADLLGPSTAMARLDVDYRAARSDAVREVSGLADRVSQRLDGEVSWSALMVGALLLAEVAEVTAR